MRTAGAIILILAAIGFAAAFILYAGYADLAGPVRESRAAYAELADDLMQRDRKIFAMIERLPENDELQRDLHRSLMEGRRQLSGIRDTENRIQAHNRLTQIHSDILVKLASDSTLRTEGEFQRLTGELASADSATAKAIEVYNESVRTYNRKIGGLPGKLMAGMFHLKPKTLLEIPEIPREAAGG